MCISLFEPLVGVACAEPTIFSFLSLLSEWLAPNRQSSLFEPLVGFEPTTPRLQITCSGQLS